MANPIEAVIGLEVHVQLATETKAFCGDSTSFGAPPNTQVSPISLAHPGTLPRINQKHIEYAVRLGLSMNCTISTYSYFDRKHYFYADLPKGFQTTQDHAPICTKGLFEFMHQGAVRKIRLHHIHMEEDAGKSLHTEDQWFSKIDLNRAGVPLVEIVTEPDFRSGEEVYDFIHALRTHVQYLGISDGNMEEGSLRCDCNISVRYRGEAKLNNRCEIKNVNSARYARQAINYEIERQSKLLEKGKPVLQQTREFLPDSGTTKLLRTKEEAYDYRYFPEPDIPPIVLSADYCSNLAKSLGETPMAKLRRYTDELHLDMSDAVALIASKSEAEKFEGFAVVDARPPQRLAKFWINQVLPLQQANKDLPSGDALHQRLTEYLDLLDSERVNRSVANTKLWPLVFTKALTIEQIARELGILREADDEIDLDALVLKIITEHPEQSAKLRSGKKALLAFFIGQVMRATNGKADPKAAAAAIQHAFEK